MSAVPSSLEGAAARRTRIVGVLCGLVVALIWSGWSVATRFAVTTSLGPHDVTFLRYGLSALLLWPILVRKGLGIAQIGIVRLIVMVSGAGVPFMMLSSVGMRYAPASHVATLMIAMMPVFVAVLSGLLLGERFTRRQLAGMAVVVTGVLCIGGWAVFADRSAGEWRGDLLFLLASLCFAGFTLAQRRSGISPWHATALVNVFSAVLYAPIYFVWLEPRIFTAPAAVVGFQLMVQGIAVAILGLYFYTQAVRHLGASSAAIFAALVPALAASIGAVVLEEFPPGMTLAGVALVMGGVARFVTGGRAGAAR